jgi:flagellar basal body-associated protein FliL
MMKKTKSKMSLGKRIAICILVPIITFAIVLGTVLALNGKSECQPPEQQADISSSESVYEVMYQDDMITVSYVEIFE